MYIQDDPIVNGYRVWYTTEDTLYAASYAIYSSTVVWEEAVYEEPITRIDTKINMRDGNLLYGSVSDVD